MCGSWVRVEETPLVNDVPSVSSDPYARGSKIFHTWAVNVKNKKEVEETLFDNTG